MSETTADDEFMEAFKDACSRGIVLGRRLKPRMITGDPEAAREFGQAMGKWMAGAGTTGGWNPEQTTLTLTIAWDEGNGCWLWIVNQGRRCEGCNHVLSRSAAFEAAVACAKEVLNQ